MSKQKEIDENQEPELIVNDSEDEVKNDEPTKTTKFKLNLVTMKVSEVKDNE